MTGFQRPARLPAAGFVGAGRPVVARMLGGLLVLVFALWFAAAAGAQTAPSGEPRPPNVDALLKLLADPSVQKWLEAQQSGAAAPAAEAAPSPSMGSYVGAVRGHVARLAAAIPGLPDEAMRARSAFMADMNNVRPVGLLALIAAFAALGFGAQWLYRWATGGFSAWIAALPMGTVRERLLAVAASLVVDLGSVVAFALGSVGAFLVFDWPPLLREIILAFLSAFVAVRLAQAVIGAMLSPPRRPGHPDPAALRIVPTSDERAAFWSRRLGAFVGVFAVGYAIVICMRLLGFSLEARYLVAYTLGLGLLAIGIEAVWRAPPMPAAADDTRLSRYPNAVKWLLTIYFVALWSLWALHAMRLFWLAVVAVLLPYAIAAAQPCVSRLLRPAGAAEGSEGPPSITAAIVERGVRLALIVAAVLLLSWAWGINFTTMAQNDTFAVRLVRGAMSAVVILLVADFLWHIARTAIDLKIAEVQDPADVSEEAHRRARLRTLLPILRMALMVVLVSVALLTALASLGVEIGPLIAGAGVVGVAVGFGSQTLVRDIISGMFYLLDDAFRVGDYIVSGNYRGIVESFSLRSVKLRHHRGPVFTVPFGVLGAIQNLSRDWVIEKMAVNITFDSDVEKARKLVKQVGLELAENPEFKSSILEPLKMQGVESFGDFGIRIRLKMKTKPNEQFTIKRKAMAMIKKAFDENGVKFASPTVRIAGEATPATTAAAAHEALTVLKPSVAAE